MVIVAAADAGDCCHCRVSPPLCWDRGPLLPWAIPPFDCSGFFSTSQRIRTDPVSRRFGSPFPRRFLPVQLVDQSMLG